MQETGKPIPEEVCEALGHEWLVDSLSPSYYYCTYCGKQVREIPEEVKDGDT